MVKEPSNAKLLKNINEKKVLRQIFQDEPISRAAISEKVGLTQQTITNIVGRFLKNGLVIEESPTPSSAGRKPIPLRINKNGLFSVGIEVTVKQIHGMLLNFNQQVIAEEKVDIESFSDNTQALQIIVGIIETLLQSDQLASDVKGIGISVQGLVDSDNGIVLNAAAFHWHEFKLKEQLEAIFDIPVYAENDVNIMAVVENVSGQLRHSNDNIILKFDHGIGGAIVVNKKLHTGAHHVAGEFGHYKAFEGENAIPCTCGNKGCLTTLASIGGLEKYLGKNYKEIVLLRDQVDPAIQGTFFMLGQTIGKTLANIITFFNPDHILLTGRLVNDDDGRLIELIKERVDLLAAPYTRDVPIEIIEQRQGAIMAGELVVSKWLQLPSI